ncbi:MAG: phosphonate ABC transporter permease, partial [Betaproteobacteria bacterium SG8_39]
MNARGLLTLLVLGGLLWMSVAYLEFDTDGLFTLATLASFGRYVAQFFPPDTSGPFLIKLWSGTLETLAISALATLLAAIAGLLIAVPAAGRFGLAPRLAARFVLNALRSVPELVFAALMVIAAGLGPFPGTLALALHTTGVL